MDHSREIEPYMLPLLRHNTQQCLSDKSSQQLIALFDQNLNISEESLDKESPADPFDPRRTDTSQPDIDSNKYSTSQHYHPSIYNPFVNHTFESRPPQPYRDNDLFHILIQNDVSLPSLHHAQLKLFEESTPDERQKLIMLWRLAPPSLTRDMDQDPLNRVEEYLTTTLEHEV